MAQQTKKSRSDNPSSQKRRKREETSILWHFECMDRINLAMQGTNDLEQVMKDVLDTLLSIFECDRAFLVYPCDPEAATWQVPMERVRPEYPGALPVGIEMPLTADGAEVFRSLRATKGPVQFGPGREHDVDPDTRETFNIQSYIAMALYPKIGKPWSFGLHQCSHARTWTAEEERLLQEIGGRLSDTLTSLLAYRNLQKSEQQVKQLIEASPVAMIVASGIEEHVEWMNDKFTELFGYTVEDVPDVEHWWPLAYPDEAYRRKLQAQWTMDVEQAIREKGQTRPIEAVVRCKDGSRRFIEFRFSSIGEKHLVTFVDLTERRNAEEKLLTSERNYREVFENVSDALFLLEVTEDGHFRNMEVNRAFEISTGFSRDQLLGKIIEEVVPQETADAVNAKYRHCLEAGTVIEEEVKLQLPTGLQTYHSSLIPVRDDSGRIYRIIGITRDITESRRMQEALRASEEELRSLINTMTDIIFVGNADGRFLKIMDTNPPLLYKPSQELLGRTLHEVFPKDLADFFLDHLHRALRTRRSVNFEYSLPIGGEEIWFYATISPMTDDKTLMVARDITEQKRAAEALAAREREYRTLAEYSPDNVARYDVNCRTIYVNPALEKTLGRPASEMIGTLPAEAGFIVEAEEFHAKIVNVLKTGQEDEMDLVLPDMGDGVHYHNIRFVAERGADGAITGVQAIGRDITERRQVQDALQESEERLRQIASSLREVVWLRDAKTRQVLYVNPAFQELTGRTRESFYENRDAIIDAIHPDDRKWVTQALDQRSESVPFHKEHRIIHLDGSVRWVSSRSFAVRNDAGEVYRWASSMEDITERKLAENALRDSEEKYRLLHENAGVGIGYYKPNGEIISYNQLAASYMNGNPEDFEGKSMYEVFPSAEAEFYMERISRSVKTESTLAYEDQLKLPAGEKWFLSVFTRICDAQQHVIGVQIISQDITEQKRAEQALRESERRLVAAQHLAHVGYWERDFDANRVVLSDEACRIFGISEQGRSLTLDEWHPRWVALIHPEDQPRLIKLLGDVLAGIRTYDVEYRVIRPDGTVRYVYSQAEVERDILGQPRNMLGMMQDITERKQAELALRASENRFRVLSENAFVGIYVIQDGRLSYCNSTQAQIFGYTPEELIGTDPTLLVHPDDQAMVLENIRRRIDGEIETIHYEFRGRCKDGSIKNIEVLGGRVDFSGKTAVIGNLMDITDRKRAENEIGRSLAAEKKARKVAEILREATESLSRTLHLEEILQKLLGYLLQLIPYDSANVMLLEGDFYLRVVALRGYERWTDPDAARKLVFDIREIPSLHELVTTKKSIQIANTYEYPGWARVAGTEHIVSWLGIPIITDGQVIGLYSVDKVEPAYFSAEDRLLAEGLAAQAAVAIQNSRLHDQITRANVELEQRVADRTAQLEETNSELEAFAYSVSHDLRAPLRHIDGFIELLQKRTKTHMDDKSQHYMDMIGDSAQKMGMLIDDLLTFSRMGRQEIYTSKVDLNDLIQDILRDSETETKGRNIQWKISRLPLVTGDRAMLRIVLANLLANAVKFTRPTEFAEIEIGYEANESEITLFVRDNGVGFDMKYADKLFGVFQRLHSQEDFEGTGIGLANVHRIIRRHGGRTWAEGEVDRGATFYFSIPSSTQEKR